MNGVSHHNATKNGTSCVDIHALNTELIRCADRKDMERASRLYHEALSCDIANAHTFASYMNCCVRCGDYDQAIGIYNELKVSKSKKKNQVQTSNLSFRKVKLNIIHVTTIVKAYCEIGNIVCATEVIDEMSTRNIIPNIRTLNTYLRGCMQIGAVNEAEVMFNRMQKVHNVVPDVSAWEYLVSLLSQNLSLNKILPIIGRLKQNNEMDCGMVSMNLNISQAAVLLGDIKLARRCLNTASKYLESNTSSECKEATTIVKNKQIVSEAEKRGHEEVKVIGGKRGWVKTDPSKIDSHSRRLDSLQIFNMHKAEEQRLDISSALTMLDNDRRLGKVGYKRDDNSMLLEHNAPIITETEYMLLLEDDNYSFIPSKPKGKTRTLMNLLPYYSHLLCFIPHRNSSNIIKSDTGSSSSSSRSSSKGVKDEGYDYSSSKHSDITPNALSQHDNVLESLYSTFGLRTYVEQFSEDTLYGHYNKKETFGGDKSDNNEYDDSKIIQIKPEYVHNFIRTKVYSYFDSDGTIDFHRVFHDDSDQETFFFRNKSKDMNMKTKNIFSPLKLEICSGSGEWVTSQAKQDSNSNYVAMELKYDRVYKMFYRNIIHNLKNLCICGGNAIEIIENHVKENSFDNIFINHPEPPQQRGYSENSQGKHLLTGSFLQSLGKILKPGGLMTIVTDNLLYSKYLIKILSNIPNPRVLHQVQDEVIMDRKRKIDTEMSGKAHGKSHHTKNYHNDSSLKQIYTENGFIVFAGSPDNSCGHVVNASSYFDRLSNKNSLHERYILLLRKSGIGENEVSLRIRHYQKGRAPIDIQTGGKAKKIKFDDDEDN